MPTSLVILRNKSLPKLDKPWKIKDSSGIVKHKIYLLDDHPVVIEGLKQIVNSQSDMEVIGSSDDANVALEQIGKLKPEVIILDITLKDRSGLARPVRGSVQLYSSILESWPESRGPS